MSKNLFQAERQAEIEDAILDAEYSEYLYYAQEEQRLIDYYEATIKEKQSITKSNQNQNENKQN